MLFSHAECAKTVPELVRLWKHEAQRVYSDKLVDMADLETYDKLQKEIIKKNFEVFIFFYYYAKDSIESDMST